MDYDCNGDGILDSLQLVGVDPVPDCNGNGVPDTCDIDGDDPDANGASSDDTNENNIPDECEAVLAIPTAPHDAAKHRYVSIDTSGLGDYPVALKVQLTSMRRCSDDLNQACTVDNDCDGGASGPCDSHSDEGSIWWVQAPQQEPLGCLPGPCGDDDWFARVEPRSDNEDAPFLFDFRKWTENIVHIGDCEVVPVATYEISACLPPNGIECTDSVEVATIKQPLISPGFRGNFGDVAGNVDAGTGNYTPPDGNGNITDIAAYIFTKQNYGTSNLPQAHPTWVDLNGLGDGQPPNYILNVSDLGQILKALQSNEWTDDPGNLNPGGCPDGPVGRPSPPGGTPIEFTLVANDDIIDAEEDVKIDVYMDAASTVDIGAFEIRLKVTGGTAGELLMQDAKVQKFCNGGANDGQACSVPADCAAPGTCDPTADYVFGTDTAYDARSLVTKQLSNAKASGGASVTGLKYLATYTFQPSQGATGVFTIEVEEDYNLSFFNDSDGVLLASQGGATEVVGVGIDCLDDSHCEQIACRTGTCVDYACITRCLRPRTSKAVTA